VDRRTFFCSFPRPVETDFRLILCYISNKLGLAHQQSSMKLSDESPVFPTDLRIFVQGRFEIGDQVDVEFDIDGALTVCRGKIVRKLKSKSMCKVDFEDGDSFNVPLKDLRPVPCQEGNQGMGI
jgi:hypothetical protein